MAYRGAKKNYGTFVPAEQEIQLQQEYVSGSMAAETVLHELMHAIFAVATVQVKQGEEHIVCPWSPPISRRSSATIRTS